MTQDLRSLYVVALQNTHALEMQALQIMSRQVERLEHYPEMEQILRRHIEETHGQRDRLEEALSGLAEKPSGLKEGVLGMVGNVMALAHTPAQDEILKNAFANQAFENFEIAAYRSLITIAEMVGSTNQMGALEKSLQEEVAMAKAISDLIPPTTKRYVELTLAGEKAGR